MQVLLVFSGDYLNRKLRLECASNANWQSINPDSIPEQKPEQPPKQMEYKSFRKKNDIIHSLMQMTGRL